MDAGTLIDLFAARRPDKREIASTRRKPLRSKLGFPSRSGALARRRAQDRHGGVRLHLRSDG
jgi:hypothetical protein